MQSDLIIVSTTSAAMTLAHPALASLPPFSFLVTFYVFPSPLAACRMPHAAYLSQQPPPTPSLTAAHCQLHLLVSAATPAPGAHLVSLLLCTAITYIQGTTYKIILYINNEERVHRSHNLPAVKEK